MLLIKIIIWYDWSKNLSFIALVIFLIKQWITLSKRKKAIET